MKEILSVYKAGATNLFGCHILKFNNFKMFLSAVKIHISISPLGNISSLPVKIVFFGVISVLSMFKF